MKLLFLDIETSPVLCFVWDLFNQNVSIDQIVEPTKMLCWAAKWLGDKKVHWGRDVKGIHKLISEADAICTYYGKNFDEPHLNREFLVAGLDPPPPVAHVDLKQVVARKFKMTSSKLGFVGPYLGIGEKVANSGWSLWRACLAEKREAWKKMRAYNEQDVVLLEKLYVKLLPWIDEHPNAGLLEPSAEPKCPNCGSESIQRRGIHRSVTQEYARFHCQACGRWSRQRTATKGRRPLVR